MMKTDLTQEEITLITTYRKLNKAQQGLIKDMCSGDDATRQYTLSEAQAILNVSYKTALGYIQSGKLPAVRVGGKWKINRSDFETFAYGNNSNVQ